jgi:dihydroorotate dehydrogenase (NAD+) catalytic subunit
VSRSSRATTDRATTDLTTAVGSVHLANPVMTASGTSGHGAELGAYGALHELGAVVVKSLSADPWPGNPPPRVREARGGMLNSVGLQGPGLEAWLDTDLPALTGAAASVVVSVWGRTVDEFGRAATMLRHAAPAGTRPGGPGLVAVEVNVSCPNLEDRARMFAHSATATEEAVAASECGLPRWAKLSPNVADVREIAAAARSGGAEAVTLVNTLLGMIVDVERRRPALGAGGGGLSGPALHPVAVRAVWECREAFPDMPIVGVGGVGDGRDAVELLLAGAQAVQVGSATFRDPRAPWKVLRQLERWCRRHAVARVSELCGAAHAAEGSAAPDPVPPAMGARRP